MFRKRMSKSVTAARSRWRCTPTRSPAMAWAMSALLMCLPGPSSAAVTQKHYYAHDAVEDGSGVIAPWYRGQNGQFDLRVRVAAETLRRYPWLDKSRSEKVLPEYLLSSLWKITPDGTISVSPLKDWMNGDRGQLAAYVLYMMPEYYRYSGDPMAVAHATLEADAFLDLALTGEEHPWPRFPISVPVKGKPYGKCDPKGFMQLDLAGRVGYGMLRVYQLTGRTRYLEAVKHWGDVLAEKRDRKPGADPWGRYANFEDIDVAWRNNKLTGGVVWILYMLDELIRLGYTGPGNSIVEARDAARAFLQERLLPAWLTNDTWGRQYWDWECPVQVPNITGFAARYMMDHKECFPNWQTDCRNLLSLCLNRLCVNPASNGEVYSGAWACPESCGCCGRCNNAGPFLLCEAFARYGVEARSEWARELARRQLILVTYDFSETGWAEDNLDGGVVTYASWFEAAHLMPLKAVLGCMKLLPEVFGPNRENHIMSSSGVVSSVVYGKGRIAYSTFDAPAPAVDVLRLAFVPTSITAGGKSLEFRKDLTANGYTVSKLANGDAVVSIRHDGAVGVVVEGNDPQQVIDDGDLTYEGDWMESKAAEDFRGGLRWSDKPGAEARFSFTGNQFRIIGRADQHGGRAEITIDGARQLAGLDCWSPKPIAQQVLYSRSGLPNGKHEIRLVAAGGGNPLSVGGSVCLDAIQFSDATGDVGFGEGGGPADCQRLIFGYPKRQDYVDSEGHRWWPGCEFVVRSGAGTDSVAKAWWTEPAVEVTGTPDPELYRYGVHAPQFTVNLTVGPGTCYVRLKFAATRNIDCEKDLFDVSINGKQMVSRLNVAARAGGADRALDLVFRDLRPRNGIIEIRFTARGPVLPAPATAEAFVQAIEIGPDKDK